uniref:Uncharacterized protein LOC111137658 isoform X2 n=1 Tax=Crassostrea virginica TaxID=6565 RepID=A0A8B8EZG6_CRAVI|nr:uncharacterized protein LOC111137658 isoform X2 [Crassostrea virginica]
MTDWMEFGLLILVLVFHTVESEPDRQVVNTTCLELAKPSNQPLRLSCGTPDHYHCLLDETYTMEFEVCRAWKWIPGGKCAYFNTYGQGNVDERMCEQQPSLTLTCSTAGNQFKSSSNTQYTACYVKKATTAAVPITTSSSPVTWTSEMENSTSSSDLERIDKASQRKMKALYSVLGILVPVLTICGIILVSRLSKGLHNCKAHRFGDPESNNGKTNAPSAKENVCRPEQEPLISADDIPLMSGNARETNPVTQVQNGEEMVEVKELVDNTLGHSEHSENVQMNENLPEESEEREENKTNTDSVNESAQNCEERSQVEVNESVENTSGHSEQSGNAQSSDELGEEPEEREENKTATDSNDDNHGKEEEKFESAPTSPIITPPGSRNDLDNDHASDYESTEVFDDTIESLLRDVTNSVDEQEVKHRHQLYELLQNDGRELIQEVLRLVITRTVGKTPEELLADEAVKNKLKTILPEEIHRILSNLEEGRTSVGVLYGLIQLYSGKEPKSGWGELVSGSDIGIGDDVERLHRVYSIFKEISNPKTISVDNYTRLLDIMLTACTRLVTADGEHKDSDHALNVKCKVLADKLKAITNPTWSQSFNKAIYSFIKH